MLEYLVEFIGTFIFLTIIIFTSNPFAIGLTLAAMIAMGSRFSKCHFNPAVSFMMFLNKKIDLKNLIIYISIQIIAAFLVFIFKNQIT